VYWFRTLRPDSPSFFSASSVGMTEVRSWMMIEAEMYGMMLSAKIAIRSMAPPENMLNSPSTPPDWLAKLCRSASGSMPGSGM
jgi:hypothetical protein